MHDEEQELNSVVLKLNGRAWGVAFGLLLGGGLFIATVLLVLRGGENVGQHLSMLRIFFPGYTVSGFGSVVGFIYGFVLGYALGRLIGGVYNRLVHPAH
jgi:hypothetical protein